LWLDNDAAYLMPFVEELEDQGFSVSVIETAFEAEQRLIAERYDYVIIDVMVPTKTETEEMTYTREETKKGYNTGVVFWRRVGKKLFDQGVGVLIFTQRLDKSIRDELTKAGVPSQNFARKFQLSDPTAFVERLRGLRNSSARAS
jgi:CheY-like chemotaxis protein